MSRVYQFFFSTENPHGMGSLCMDALGDVIRAKHSAVPWPENKFRRIHARCELRTDNDKRLDILLHDGLDEDKWQKAGTLVLIENKVYHWLANDLGEYWKFTVEQNPSCTRIGIVLGLKREYIPEQWQNDWVAITHLEWAQAVEERLGAIIYRAEPRFVTLLLELIENIRTMSKTQENTKELLRFFQQHYAEIQHIDVLKRHLLDALPVGISSALPPGYVVENQSNEAKSETWLTVMPSITQTNSPSKYLIQYGGLFKNGNELKYEIHVINHDLNKCELIRQSYRKLNSDMMEYRDRHYAVHKVYTMTSGQLANFAEHIAASLKNDWMPLEYIWKD